MNTEKIINKNIADELKESYIDYAMSVIVGRAIPDVRDGLKPVHRRIIYSMFKNNAIYNQNKDKDSQNFLKSARIVGDILGKYHPHGDQAIYDSMVRLAQNFSIRYPLVLGKGNFGSLTGLPAGHMRYTEAVLDSISNEIIEDINKDTVDFMPNYDESLEEPKYLPSKLPTLLLNGSSGIAVGMSTNMAPHNLTEVCNAIIATIDNPNISIKELSKIIKGPDFPTGGIIINPKGILDAYKTGRGKIIIRGKISVETNKTDKKSLIITEIPFLINRRQLKKSIANLRNKKQLHDVSDLKDKSSKGKTNIIIELTKNGVPELVKNILYKKTKLQSSFNIINLTLVNDGLEPKVLNLKELIEEYIKHREHVIYRKTVFDQKKAKDRLHRVEGLLVALNDIDNVIKIIKNSNDIPEARKELIAKYTFTIIQADAILSMQLSRLTSLEGQKLNEEKKQLTIKIKDLEEIIQSEQLRYDIIKTELQELSKKYGDERRTEIIDLSHKREIEKQDLIKIRSNIVILTNNQYIKRMHTEEYQSQQRGGKGKKIMKMEEKDFIQDIFSCLTHDTILFFTSKGRVYSLICYNLPKQSRASRGRSIVNLLRFKEDEKIAHMIPIRKFSANDKLIFVTKNGLVKKTLLKYFANIQKTGIIAIKIREGDELLTVMKLEEENKDIFIGTKNGYAARFDVKQLKNLGRMAMGVRGINLRENDEVIDAILGDRNTKILTLTKKGYGKTSAITEYRKTSRNAKGVININFKSDEDEVIAVKPTAEQDLLIGTKKGQVVRIHCDSIRVSHRVTQGVKAIELYDDDEVCTIGKCAEIIIDEPENNSKIE